MGRAFGQRPSGRSPRGGALAGIVLLLAVGSPATGAHHPEEERAVGETVPGTDPDPSSLLALGRRQADAGELEEAGATLLRARDLAAAEQPVPIELLAEIDFALGHLSLTRGNLGHAEEYLRRAEEGFSLVEPTENRAHALALFDLGMLQMDRGDLEEGCDSLRLAADVTERQTGSSPDLAVALVGVGGCELRRGNLAEADAASERALHLAGRGGPAAAELLGEALVVRLQVLRAMGRDADAAEIQRRLRALGVQP